MAIAHTSLLPPPSVVCACSHLTTTATVRKSGSSKPLEIDAQNGDVVAVAVEIFHKGCCLVKELEERSYCWRSQELLYLEQIEGLNHLVKERLCLCFCMLGFASLELRKLCLSKLLSCCDS
jgi:hypothetical protein